MHRFRQEPHAIVLPLLSFYLILAVPAAAQEQEKQERIVDPPYWSQKGEELPMYYCVGAFFDYAFDLYSTSEATFGNLLEDLRVERGSEAARALRKHMFLGQALREEQVDLTPYENDPEVFERVQRDWLRRQVAGWRELWKSFRLAFEESGGDLEVLDVYIEEKIRPTITVWSTGPAEEAQAIIDTFEEDSP